MNKIAIFYHIGQFNHWREVYKEQVEALHRSGLYDACDFISCGINGTETLPSPIPSKISCHYNEDHVLEANTLERLWRFCKDFPEHRVLYMHTKGVTWVNEHKETTARWRRYMEHFNVFQWRHCLDKLKTHDTCGILLKTSATYRSERPDEIEMPATYYDGNFWWANASYINTLNPQFLYTNDTPWLRGKSELWIGSGNPKAACLHNLEYINPYYHGDFSKELYMTNERKAKIVMIAMFKNEAPVLRRMLDSTLGYCDYYVMQNNGSTDGSDEIAKQFLADNNLAGEVYICEQGWKGFGWNRDHLIQYCQAQDHGCDWILKMDCDEVLEVDEDFDWSPLDDHSIHAFHIPAVSGSTIYYRAWMWNTRMHWSFRHDPAHEVIYCTDPTIGENFQRYNLPDKIRQVGFNEGQSWSVPTKFVSDSLILEEKLIREQTMLSDPYHFWYIGKSYADAWPCDSFPLGDAQKREFARRTIFYFQQYNEYMYPNGPDENTVDELAYFGDVLCGYAAQYLRQYDEAHDYWWNASRWVSKFNRSEHLLALAEMYEFLEDCECAQLYTTKLIDPSNKCPFPDMMSFVDRNAYSDTSNYPFELHRRVLEKTKPSIFKVRV